LIDTIDPYLGNVTSPEDFRVTAVDGYGTDSFVVFNDIRIR
jgi:hypothetical protein